MKVKQIVNGNKGMVDKTKHIFILALFNFLWETVEQFISNFFLIQNKIYIV